MKRSLLICSAALMMLVYVPQTNADQIQLTLDLLNASPGNAASGGTWQLYARKVENGSAPNGDNGIAGFRAVLNNVDFGSVSYASGINQIGDCDGGPCIQQYASGAVEIVYGQDLSSAGVLTGIGIGNNPNHDRLIASGSWPAGAARPTFGTDPNGAGSEGNFLANAAAPWGNALEVSGANLLTSVVTLGDVNGSNTVSLTDIQPFVDVLNGVTAYNPAADVNQSGTVTLTDIQPFTNVLNGVPLLTASVAAVPEPGTVVLALVSSLALVGFRRR